MWSHCGASRGCPCAWFVRTHQCGWVRDWSLITGRGGGGYKTGGGASEVYPYEKGEDEQSFSHAEGGAQKVLG